MRLYRTLRDVIRFSYPNAEPELLRFSITGDPKSVRYSKNSDYTPDTALIRIYNYHRTDSAIFLSCLHELAHHIQWIRTKGENAHNDYYYAIYRKIIYKSLDMGLLTMSDILALPKDTDDMTKVKKMVASYRPKNTPYRPNVEIISVPSHYVSDKNLLKKMQFTYEPFSSSWELAIPNNQDKYISSELKNAGIRFRIISSCTIQFVPKQVVYAGQGAYGIKDILKKEGFQYNAKTHEWYKYTGKGVSCRRIAEQYARRFRNVDFYYGKESQNRRHR